MVFVDCFWEKGNLGERVCELTYAQDEVFCPDVIDRLSDTYSYQVIKVAAGNVPFILELQKKEFSFIETQIDWIVKLKDFNTGHPLIGRFLPSLLFEDIKDTLIFEEMLSRVDEGMFSSDRIALDPHYGFDVGRNRYCNWMRNEFGKESSFFSYITYDGTRIGFLMLKVNNSRGHGALAGIFKEYQDLGFGILTASSMPLYIIDRSLDVKVYETSTSSNNTANTKIYSTLGFQLKSMHYVFVKHAASTPGPNTHLLHSK